MIKTKKHKVYISALFITLVFTLVMGNLVLKLQQQLQVPSHLMAKMHLVEQMQSIINQRIQLLTRVYFTKDSFARHEEWEKSLEMGGHFIQLRQKFERLNLSPREKQNFSHLLKKIQSLSAKHSQIMEQFVSAPSTESMRETMHQRMAQYQQLVGAISTFFEQESQWTTQRLTAQKTSFYSLLASLLIFTLALGFILLKSGRYSQRLSKLHKKQLHRTHIRTQRALKLRKKHQILSLEKSQLEKDHNHITQSLDTAHQIQHAILPPTRDLKILSDYFVVWQPKDKVGGDYYWIHRCGRGTLVAVIDCTGHGVPGALMTVIAHAALRQIISTIDISRLNPALILQELNGLVKASLTPPENIRHANEGMDVSICLIETHKNLVTFAAAKQDLYYTQGDDVRLIKGNRQSIGYHQSKYLFSYTNHKIDLNSQPTSFYLTTDGWLDQGSEKPPHFPYGKKRFMKSIKDHSHLPMAKQKTAFLSDMEQWQSAEEAYDDITLLGFSVFSRHYIKNQL